MRFLILGLLIGTWLPGQVAKEANEHYQTPEGRAQVARGVVGPDRDKRQRPKDLISALELKPGMTVVDVGTAAGYMLPYLSDAVGPGGRVIAEDIFPDFLDAARKRVGERKNIDYILGTDRDAKLPHGVADVILVLDAYHHFDYPKEMLDSLRRALKPQGRLVIVEYHQNEKAMPGGRALEHVRASRDEFVKEIEGYGFETLSVRDFIPDVQWIGFFRARQ